MRPRYRFWRGLKDQKSTAEWVRFHRSSVCWTVNVKARKAGADDKYCRKTNTNIINIDVQLCSKIWFEFRQRLLQLPCFCSNTMMIMLHKALCQQHTPALAKQLNTNTSKASWHLDPQAAANYFLWLARWFFWRLAVASQVFSMAGWLESNIAG